MDNQTKSKFTQKQLLTDCLSIYENLIHLEISLKHGDAALQLCERFLKADSTLTNIWLLKIYISVNNSNLKEVHFCINNDNSIYKSLFFFKVIENALLSCPYDALIHLNIAKYYDSTVCI